MFQVANFTEFFYKYVGFITVLESFPIRNKKDRKKDNSEFRQYIQPSAVTEDDVILIAWILKPWLCESRVT